MPLAGALIPQFDYTSVADLYARQLRLRLPQAATTMDHPDTPQSSIGDNYSSNQHPIDIAEVLVQLHGASTDEHKLQIIYDTIVLQVAAPA
jgi:hypothetical protein